MAVDYTVSRPPVAAALTPFVSSIGYLRGRFAHSSELALPSGTVQLLVNLDQDRIRCGAHRSSGAGLQGPFTRPTLIDPADQREIVWVAFRFGGSYPFFPVDAGETQDLLIDLADLWGPVSLRDRLLAAPTVPGKLRAVEELLVARAIRPLDPDPAVAVAAAALHRGATVREVADRLGWTPRWLGRRFGSRVGLAPKRFARIRRFQRLLRARLAAADGATDGDWGRLAARCGYHDQAHMIHEFRELSGITPGGYRPRSAEEPNHVPVSTSPAT